MDLFFFLIIAGGKEAADKAILVAMLLWALDNPPPAHMFLISGDGDFANALHRLRMKGYSVLLARPDHQIKPALLAAATVTWYWTSVAKGSTLNPNVLGISNNTEEQQFDEPNNVQPPLLLQKPEGFKDLHLNIALDKVTRVMRALKQDGLMPTLQNIQECLQYWCENVDLRSLLAKAMMMQEVKEVNVNPGNNVSVFLPSNTQLWDCVDTDDMEHAYPHCLWLHLTIFFCDVEKLELIRKSRNRYMEII